MGLQLVSEYTDSAYPERHEHFLRDPNDANEIAEVRNSYLAIAESIDLSDYKVLHANEWMIVHLASAEDLKKFRAALHQDQSLEDVISLYDPKEDFRKIKNARSVLERHARRAGILDVTVAADRESKTLIVQSANSYARSRFFEIADTIPRFMPTIRPAYEKS